jgi:hypothetical protein
VFALALGAWLGAGLTIGACEPLDIALYPPAPDAGALRPVDISPPVQQEPPDAASSPPPEPEPESEPETEPDPEPGTAPAPDAGSIRPPCLPGAALCDACVSAANCPDGRVCHPLTGACVVPCPAGAACPSPAVCNLLLEVCVDCIDESHCTNRPGEPLCDTDRGVCVECRTSDDCVAEPLRRPVCLSGSQRCGCATNADCPLGSCEIDEAHCEEDDSDDD